MARLLTCVCVLFFIACDDPFLPIGTHSDAPLLVVTFDDAHESVYTYGYRLMRETDTTWAATHFFANNYINGFGNVTLAQLLEMERGGWESGGHGLNHDNLSSLPADTAAERIRASYAFLAANGLSHESYAYAYGMYNDTVKAATAALFANVRTARDYYYLDGVNRTELGYFAVKSGFSSDDIIARVEEAKRLGSPLVIIGFHVIQPDTAADLPVYWCKESVFRGFLQYCKDQHMRPMTVREAMGVLVGR
jgi:peptidoglycan/xylan/chitin deacetylase (PgdA/CDA1 family)